MKELYKYPRTHHLAGSRRQPGDEELDDVPFAEIAGEYIVVEEKVDGANSGISFTTNGELRLQSRGHFLIGGTRERHFNLFKTWANCHQRALWERLGSRYILYGEWLYAKHTIYYDQLPHYFLEFDILDTEQEKFLSTARRRELLKDLPIASVPVLWSGTTRTLKSLTALIVHSNYKSLQWREQLRAEAHEQGLNSELIQAQTDYSDLMEGLYIKVETGAEVMARYKYIRASFLTAVLDSGSHWLERPILPNRLRAGTDIFAPQL